ncbi:hypothetical protein COU88_00935 [Candidatus Roizmanbacteria bacterium CG10_big_fil_rev_8_21_14_0_10_39_6]|uniref:UDP-N-acetylglucosamine kinase n=1 Tax=Candidatus Roizmanbacteria bacterium CG10_big_fil_rev_8_21_14_0_10_39_6 TaxID=1974853 RepID=A0A2M8KTE5_9BACT|nr:MAG: hypothetical protein COU88_00935 [Candidatus Roizmanbacteria bacterium CG10_big_fil_rev_8_21_14_0_10_39_6]
MKLVLIDGGPASGKNTLGEILVADLNAIGEKSVLLDHDSYIEKLCSTWIWISDEQKESDLLSARISFIEDINKSLQQGFTVITIGVRFLTVGDVSIYTSKLAAKYPVYLYHLSVPLLLRKQRLNQRGPHSLIDLDKDQKDRDAITTWPGYVYHNVNSPESDAKELMKLIQANEGLIDVNNS